VAIYYYALGGRVGRGTGKGAVASAAYLSRERYTDERTQTVHDYRAHANDDRASAIAGASHYIGRKGRHGRDMDPPLFEGLYAPKEAPNWCRGKEQIEEFWNRAEAAEKHPRAQIAEKYIIALPHELNLQQNVWAIQDHLREFTREGRVVQLAIHAPDRGGDERNMHAHLLVSTRGVDEHGLKAIKYREQSERFQNRGAYVEHLRENWAHVANRHLARHGHEARLDHRSYERQGVEHEAQWHVGPGDMRKERQGEQTRFGDHNREVAARNAEREEIDRELQQLRGEVVSLEKAREERHRAGERVDRDRELLGERAPEVPKPAVSPAAQEAARTQEAAREPETAEIDDLDDWRRDLEPEPDAEPQRAEPPAQKATQEQEADREREAPAPANGASDGREDGRERRRGRGLFGRAGAALRRAGEAALDWVAPRVAVPEPPRPVDHEAERRQKEERARADREHMLRMYQEMNDALSREDSPLYQRFEAEREAARNEREAALKAVDERLAGIAAEQRRFYDQRFAEEKIINPGGPLRHEAMLALMIQQREARAALREEAQHERREAREKHPVLLWEEWLRREADRGDKDAQRALKTRERRRERERSRERDDDELEL
jgi:hypothetical protein